MCAFVLVCAIMCNVWATQEKMITGNSEWVRISVNMMISTIGIYAVKRCVRVYVLVFVLPPQSVKHQY
jgi:hypothetical protein